MPSSQRARSGVPVSQRSILQDVPGVSAFVAVLIAAGATFLGVVLCAAGGGSDLTRTFSVCYLSGCVVAALVVRYRGLFTAVVQPPLLLFVAVPLAFQVMSEDSGTSPKDIALNAAIPLVDRFPLMLFTTLVTLAIGAYRVYIKRLGPAVASERRGRTTPTQQTTSPRTAPRSTAPRSAGRPESAAPRQRPASSSGSTSTGQPARMPQQRPASPQAVRMPTARSEMPAHPMPQVRYRDREGMTNEA